MKCYSMFFLFGVAFAAVTPKKDRVMHHSLSDKEPGTHDYDHDAFVGAEEAEEFEKLSPEESQRRLGIMADKIDKDGNGKITQAELEDWIHFVQTRYVREDAERQFKSYDNNDDSKIDWEEYMQTAYGFVKDEDAEYRKHDNVNYTKLIHRDQRRFKTADKENDDALTLEEFQIFLHPEEFEHMRNIVALETLEDIDKNQDGFVDVEEYIGDMHDKDSGEEPEWLPTEREHFFEFRDVNKDGKMDAKEVKNWIMPDDYDHIKSESLHLINISDDDKDGELTKEEIVNHYDNFVGSQATEWGEALNRHDEF